jgi:UPF0755 protein
MARRSRGRLRWVLLIALVGVTGGVWAVSRGNPQGDPVRITVPRGVSFGGVADSLIARGIISSKLETPFRLFARIQRADRGIKAGTYEFRRRESWNRILSDLTVGRVVNSKLTVPEGFSLASMAPRIAEISGSSVDDVLGVLTEKTLAGRMGLPGPSLEGYLFPDTYLFEPGSTVESVVTAMVSRYRAYWTPQRRELLAASGMSERDVVTLASIIQAEALRESEMPTIASVYRNRVRIGQALQADPTVLYALGGHRDRLLFAAIDSVADNPYNTYRHPGLPPGPICSPGERALDAALTPDSTQYLYFVAKPDGSHMFTKTFDEHTAATAEARRQWDTARAAAIPRGAQLDSAVSPGRGRGGG